MGDYVTAFAIGFMLAVGVMIFAVALAILLGRWVAGDESGLAFVIRATMLLLLAGAAILSFGTIWYFVAAVAGLFPLAEFLLGDWLSAGWVHRRRDLRLGEAVSAAAVGPATAISRLHLAQGLLETGQVDAGLAALEAALSLADQQSRLLIEEMAGDARRDFVRSCPHCRTPNRIAARVCRLCLRPFAHDPLTRVASGLSRPMLGLLRRFR